MQDIDVVYVLGTGSPWNNNEIRFSLRALEKNLEGFRKVFVVGEKPEFLQNITHIPCEDIFSSQNADGNIITKVLKACKNRGLTSKFLFINDDHIVIKPIRAEEVPPFHKGDLTKQPKEYFEENFWRGRLFRTRNILVKKGLPAKHYDCHTPIVFHKKKFPEVVKQFEYEKGIGYTMKSLYGNIEYQDAPRLSGEKVTLFRPFILRDIEKRVSKATFVAFNDTGLSPALKTWLYKMFPAPSKFEKPVAEEQPFIEVLRWLSDPERTFETGRMIFEKHGKGKKVMKYLAKGESEARMMKLEHRMRVLINNL